MQKYFINQPISNGEILEKVFLDLYNTKNYKNILFVRTPTTGIFLDKIVIKDNNITRILYDTKIIPNFDCDDSTIIIDRSDLLNSLIFLNKKYDLICLDPFHLYEDSIRDMELLSSFLTDNGVLLCHDCFPTNINLASPIFIEDWCGQTYIAFVELAYKNPNWYYGVLNIDTGIGILSKTYMNGLVNTLNSTKQQLLLDILINNLSNDLLYNYYCENSTDLINLIHKK
jgi:hypothetical protein